MLEKVWVALFYVIFYFDVATYYYMQFCLLYTSPISQYCLIFCLLTQDFR